jgi:L-alanine-DL-glutamate epimerase-like enolase superfamily enzyme
MLGRREFLATALSTVAYGVPAARIAGVGVVKYQGARRTTTVLEVSSDKGPVGRSAPLESNVLKLLPEMMPKLREFLVGKDPLDRKLEFGAFWDLMHPGHPLRAFAGGIDPLTGKKIWGTIRGDRTSQTRHTPTGVEIIALTSVDNSLWDLRGKLLNEPVHRLVGKARRERIPVYTRVAVYGDGRDLKEVRKQARARYDQGGKTQKWYFLFGRSDGEEGFRANLEVVRTLREELPDATLMFDNHSMRYEIGGDWVVRLAKAMLPYKPFWLEEPTAPEDLEGYRRIKGETGITIAAGEHHYTRFLIQPFLESKCLDWVQSDPDWCGGISEWLRICDLARKHPGVRVVPHSTCILTDTQCVASQPESLCPLIEYNVEQSVAIMSLRTPNLEPVAEVLTVPGNPGLGPDLDPAKCKAVAGS